VSYAKLVFESFYSANSDYSEAEMDTLDWDPTLFDTSSAPGRLAYRCGGIPVAGSTTVVGASTYNTLGFVLVRNRDPSLTLTVTYRSAGGSATGQTVQVPPGGLCLLPDITVSVAVIIAGTAGTLFTTIAVGT
jgi:hypothetical protein